MKSDAVHSRVSCGFRYGLTCFEQVCGINVSTLVWDCGLRITVCVAQMFRDALYLGEINSCTHGMDASFDEDLAGHLVMGTVVPPVNSTTWSRGRMTLVWASQRSHPTMTTLPKPSTTLNVMVPEVRFPTLITMEIVPAITTTSFCCVLYAYVIFKWSNEVPELSRYERGFNKTGSSTLFSITEFRFRACSAGPK